MTTTIGFTYEGAKKAAAESGVDLKRLLKIIPITLDSFTTIEEGEELLRRVDDSDEKRKPIIAKIEDICAKKLRESTTLNEYLDVYHDSPDGGKTRQEAWNKAIQYCLKRIDLATTLEEAQETFNIVNARFSCSLSTNVAYLARNKLYEFYRLACLDKAKKATTSEEVEKIIRQYPNDSGVFTPTVQGILDQLYLGELERAITAEDTKVVHIKISSLFSKASYEVKKQSWDKLSRLYLEKLDQVESEEEIRSIYDGFAYSEVRLKAEAKLVKICLEKMKNVPTIEAAKEIRNQEPFSDEIDKAFLIRIYQLANALNS